MTPWYPTEVFPAAGVFIREHARAAAVSNDVTVLHLAGAADQWAAEQVTDKELTAGIRTWRLWHRSLPIAKTDAITQAWGLDQAIKWLKIEHSIVPDLIHAHVYLAGFPSVLVGSLRGIPVVVSEHYSAFPLRLLARHDLVKARVAFSLARRVLPVSSMLQESIEGCGLKGEFEVIPNVVDTELFFPSNAEHAAPPFTFLFVGHLYEEKGIGDLLTALADTRLQSRDWALVVIGGGSQRRWKVVARNMGIANRISFTGPLPKGAVADWMRISDALVIPSWIETQSVVLLEAMASGLPVIASDLKALSEVMLPGAGVRFPVRQPTELARTLLAFLDDAPSPEIRPVVHEARRLFGMQQVGSRLDDLYGRILSEQTSSHHDGIRQSARLLSRTHMKSPVFSRNMFRDLAAVAAHRLIRRMKRVKGYLLSPSSSEVNPALNAWVQVRGDKTLRLDYELKPDSVVLDVGGFEGQWASDIYAKYGCKIHVFEPVPEFADFIQNRFEKNPHIVVHRYGLGARSRNQNISVEGDRSSVFKPGADTKTVQIVEARVAFAELGLTSVDLIKINIEGGEYELLDHLSVQDLLRVIRHIQVQFHDFVPGAREEMERIRNLLARTHEPVYQYPFVWEGWSVRGLNAMKEADSPRRQPLTDEA